MRTRRIVNNNVVWFGSYGLNEDGTAKFYNNADKHDNYSTKQQAVIDSLIQRLSVFKNELWYSKNYGLILFEKAKNKALVDSNVLSIVSQHPDIISIKKFNSVVQNHSYKCEMILFSTFGDISIQI